MSVGLGLSGLSGPGRLHPEPEAPGRRLSRRRLTGGVTISGSWWSKNSVAPVPSAAIAAIRSSVSTMSKTLMFSAMRSVRTDLGMVTMLRWISRRSTGANRFTPT
ncbi:hypothetical protein [Embleya sp. NPDC020886]|uniref:hypothetical protein n=1 Tax=Embleya sp. NPDC020886 TaxID=3363980 RepID=UPI00379375B7